MIRISLIETSYDYILKTVFSIANPFKKKLIKTQCQVHKSINVHAINILKNDKYFSEYNFFNNNILEINKGAVWADQDFKSSNHFYHPYNRKNRLYGRKSALDLGVDYYLKSLKLWRSGDYDKSFFFLGAALHIIQDMTIPQHANVRLLDNHRQYETFVKRTYQYIEEFSPEKGAYLLKTIESYIKTNARIAICIHKRYRTITDNETRFYKITKCSLPLATRTTAGAMIMFYKNISTLGAKR